ncbi:MAG: hypothetical protein NVV74_06780 [Magnetospirillum sp.]|nr:hypothetical protein [Magnetospirillum sp.]
MPERGAMDERGLGYEEDLAAANAAEFSEDGADMLLPGLADSVVGSAGDPEEALAMCRDLANAEDLDDDQYLALVALVEEATGWELPEEG